MYKEPIRRIRFTITTTHNVRVLWSRTCSVDRQWTCAWSRNFRCAVCIHRVQLIETKTLAGQIADSKQTLRVFCLLVVKQARVRQKNNDFLHLFYRRSPLASSYYFITYPCLLFSFYKDIIIVFHSSVVLTFTRSFLFGTCSTGNFEFTRNSISG